jgi:hypothetical protein
VGWEQLQGERGERTVLGCGLRGSNGRDLDDAGGRLAEGGGNGAGTFHRNRADEGGAVLGGREE